MELEIGVKCLYQVGVRSSDIDPLSETTCCHPFTSAQTLNIPAIEQKAPFPFISNVFMVSKAYIFHTARTGQPVETSHQWLLFIRGRPKQRMQGDLP